MQSLTYAILMFDAGHGVLVASEDSGSVSKLQNPRTTCVISASTVDQLIHHLTTETSSLLSNLFCSQHKIHIKARA